jgi:hypothetical protein
MALGLFDDDQIAALVSKLLNLSLEGKIAWRAQEENQYQFQTNVGRTYFSISSRDSDDLAPHTLGIFRAESDGEMTRLQEEFSNNLSASVASELADLYALVKRRVLKLDTLAEEILGSLDQLEDASD